MYLPMLPRHYFEAGLRKTNEGRQFLERLEPAVAPVGKSATVHTAETRPFLFCEGTGIIDSIGFKDPTLNKQREFALGVKSFAGLKHPIPHEQGAPSPFYYAHEFGITDQFISEGINVGGFIYGTVNPGVCAFCFICGFVTKKKIIIRRTRTTNMKCTVAHCIRTT